MPVITNQQSVASGATVENLVAGSFLEYLPRPANLEIGVVALSGALGDVRMDVTSGADLLAENAAVRVNAAGVNLTDDLYLEDIAAAGERLKIRVRNTSGGAIIVQHFVRVTYLG